MDNGNVCIVLLVLYLEVHRKLGERDVNSEITLFAVITHTDRSDYGLSNQ